MVCRAVWAAMRPKLLGVTSHSTTSPTFTSGKRSLALASRSWSQLGFDSTTCRTAHAWIFPVGGSILTLSSLAGWMLLREAVRMAVSSALIRLSRLIPRSCSIYSSTVSNSLLMVNPSCVLSLKSPKIRSKSRRLSRSESLPAKKTKKRKPALVPLSANNPSERSTRHKTRRMFRTTDRNCQRQRFIELQNPTELRRLCRGGLCSLSGTNRQLPNLFKL